MLNSKQATPHPPLAAIRLLLLCAPKYFAEHILGDLEEEFHLRAQSNTAAAKYWFWQQAVSSSCIYLIQSAGSLAFLRKMTLLVSLLLFGVTFQLITWLSYADSLDSFSPQFWDSLISGHIHMAIFEPAFWKQAQYTWRHINAWSFLINTSSMLLTLASGCLFIYMQRRRKFSAHQIALFGCGAMFIPYVFAIAYLNVFVFPAQMVGPVLSLMLLNIFYMILPATYMVLRQIKQQEYEYHL